MEAEKKEMEEVNMDITAIKIVEDRAEEGFCRQIRMATSEGLVTFKPKNPITKKRTLPNGLDVEQHISEMFLIAELPEVITKINNVVKKDGKCSVLATITKWDTVDREGKAVTYSFFPSLKAFEEMKIVD